MVLPRDARRVLVHTAIVVALSFPILRLLLQQSCRAPTIEQQIANIRQWQRVRGNDPYKSDIGRHGLVNLEDDEDYRSKVFNPAPKDDTDVCPGARGKEDVLFVIKTGVTEALDRLLIHIKTTLKCWPHAAVFSDFAEEIEDVTIHDALDEIDTGIRLHHPDFNLWRRLNSGGRESLTAKDFSSSTTNEASGKVSGDLGNPGWKIDKYKNLPMIEKAFRKHPNLKWYIFTDADTFISASNLMSWLHKLNHTKSLFLGNPSTSGSQTFGHGGSGYILSQPAMKAAAATYSKERGYWDNFAAQNWAGDFVLASMLQKRLDLSLTWAYPMLQAESPFAMDFTETKYSRKLWCYPAVSYHHASPDTIDALWDLERRWAATYSSKRPMRHRDVYELLVEQRLSESSGNDWDNMSNDVVDGWSTNPSRSFNEEFARCREVCERNSTCLQYSYSTNGCRTSGRPRYGKISSASTKSGWLLESIQRFMSDYDDCNDGRWILT